MILSRQNMSGLKVFGASQEGVLDGVLDLAELWSFIKEAGIDIIIFMDS